MKAYPQHNRRLLTAATLWLMAVLSSLQAQPQMAEYRIDGGQAQAMTRYSTNGCPEYSEGEFTASVSSSNLAVGPHFLEARMQGTNGVWSAWQGHWFRVAGETHLVAAEWYVDTDPGAGLATPIPLPEDGIWDEPEEDLVIPECGAAAALNEGRHQLVIRAEDSNGDWGVTSQATFYVAPELEIVNAVWVTDPSNWGAPGVVLPATNSMRLTTNAFTGELEAQATFSTLALTTNYCWAGQVYVRFQDNLGRWSTRHGLWFDESQQTWRFDPTAFWANSVPLAVRPEVASNPLPGQRHLFINANGTVTLGWNDCKGISGYAVYFRASRTAPFSLLATGFTNSSLTVASLPPLADCQWQVQSLGDPGCAIDGPLWQFGGRAPLPTTTDADQDGIPDDWERSYFGSLLAFNGSTDRDGDGLMDWEEWQADTVPTNRLDFLRILDCRTGDVNPLLGLPAIVVDWNSSSARNYTIYHASQLGDPGTIWTPIQRLPGVGGLMSFTNDWPEAVGFIMIGASPP